MYSKTSGKTVLSGTATTRTSGAELFTKEDIDELARTGFFGPPLTLEQAIASIASVERAKARNMVAEYPEPRSEANLPLNVSDDDDDENEDNDDSVMSDFISPDAEDDE